MPDELNPLWVLPPDRMKAGRGCRAPLSTQGAGGSLCRALGERRADVLLEQAAKLPFGCRVLPVRAAGLDRLPNRLTNHPASQAIVQVPPAASTASHDDCLPAAGKKPRSGRVDAILVDTGRRKRRDGGIFVIRVEDRIVVKRLIRDPVGGWLIQSDNPNKQAWPPLPCPLEANIVGDVK